MPTTPGFLLEYPCIRVDRFDQRENYPHGPVEFYLLTHIHTDHLVGLHSRGHLIPANIYCSQATKNALLKLEPQASRVANISNDSAVGHKRPYSGLFNAGNINRNASKSRDGEGLVKDAEVDLLHALPYNTPTKINYQQEVITLTLIESNHMHGGTMFLIEGSNGAVLHTGDLRAEKHWCKSLIRNPAIQRYIAWNPRDLDQNGEVNSSLEVPMEGVGILDSDWAENFDGEEKIKPQDLNPRSTPNHLEETQSSPTSLNLSQKEVSSSSMRLKNIYLDTEAQAYFYQVPSKDRAVKDMVSLLRYFPPEAQFFLNSWTWGYEDILKGVAKCFGKLTHVDDYKNSIYRAFQSEDPFLKSIVTTDEDYETRFHACEKLSRCDKIKDLQTYRIEEQNGKEKHKFIVYVNPEELGVEAWERYFRETKALLQEAKEGKKPWPASIKVPIARHSPLPELLHFVNLFRPHSVFPNTIAQGSASAIFFFFQLFHHVLSDSGSKEFLSLGAKYVGKEKWKRSVEKLERRIQRLKSEDESNGVIRSKERFSYFREALLMIVFKDQVPHFLTERYQRDVDEMENDRTRMNEIRFSDDDQGSDEEMEEQPSNVGVTQSGYEGDVSGKPIKFKENQRRGFNHGYEADISESTPKAQLQDPNVTASNLPPPSSFQPQSQSQPQGQNQSKTQPSKVQTSGKLLQDESRNSPSPNRAEEDQSNQIASSPPRRSNVLTEELAERYLKLSKDVFGRDYRSKREAASTVRWAKARKKQPTQAREAEEWLKENEGVDPPPWDEEAAAITAPKQVPSPAQAEVERVAPIQDPVPLVTSPARMPQEQVAQDQPQETTTKSNSQPAQESPSAQEPQPRRTRNSTPAPSTMGKAASDLASDETQISDLPHPKPIVRESPLPNCLETLRVTPSQDQARGTASLSVETVLEVTQLYQTIIDFFDSVDSQQSSSSLNVEENEQIHSHSRDLLNCLARDLQLLVNLFDFRFPSGPNFDRASKRKAMTIKARFGLIVSVLVAQVFSGNSIVRDFATLEFKNLFEFVLRASEASNQWHREVYLSNPTSHDLKHFIELQRTRTVLGICLKNRSDDLVNLDSRSDSDRLKRILKQMKSDSESGKPKDSINRLQSNGAATSRKRKGQAEDEPEVENLQVSKGRGVEAPSVPYEGKDDTSIETQRSQSQSCVDTQEIAELARKMRQEDEERRKRQKI